MNTQNEITIKKGNLTPGELAEIQELERKMDAARPIRRLYKDKDQLEYDFEEDYYND